MQAWTTLCLLLTATSTVADNAALFWNLYDAVISGGRILHDVADGVGAVSKAIRAIDHFLDSTAEAQVKEAIETSEKTETAPENPSTAQQTSSPDPLDTSVPIFSGCGALGLHIRDDTLPVSRLTECCGTHDLCYRASCRVNKKDCDFKLKACLYTVCDDKTMTRAVQQTCRGAAKLLFSGTMALSFQQYNSAQGALECKKPQKGGKW
ncbi:hypothetical protein OTU49_006143 [Cherax quadricarinatus]|uniref:Uncharacterized protein n=1 Tax=Cherax quadricarinatus TaxID=27406 RepID=A0AAW0WQ44_CHEQU